MNGNTDGAWVETYRGAVYPWHCDHMGHMNVMWYVGKFDEATWNLFSGIGVTSEFLRQNDRAMAAVQQNITYRRELLSGDVVAIRSGMLEMREKVAKFVHEMRHAQTGEISAVCVITAVHLDSRARKSTAFPPEFIARGRELLCGYEGER
ncbi:MAG: thioesterase family protein [Candidatus Parcubacteria bacterium]|nr:thioesterase family protein [Burkholderiales bacterium]